MRLVDNFDCDMNDQLKPDMTYPSPPWRYGGHGLIVFRFPFKKNVTSPPLCVTSGWFPGLSLSGFYLAEYDTPLVGDESKLWHEWGNVHCYTRFTKFNGFYLDIMAADSFRAITGGKEVWGLNKVWGNISFFTKELSGHANLEIKQQQIRLHWYELGPPFKRNSSINFFTIIAGLYHRYSVEMNASFNLCRVNIVQHDLPSFNALQMRNYFGLRFKNAQIQINPPKPIIE